MFELNKVPFNMPLETAVTVKPVDIGRSLLLDYAILFEGLGILLTVAIIVALPIAAYKFTDREN
jgi:NADH:ubiquinone oxidoreductase subunit 6 (subunit J)